MSYCNHGYLHIVYVRIYIENICNSFSYFLDIIFKKKYGIVIKHIKL